MRSELEDTEWPLAPEIRQIRQQELNDVLERAAGIGKCPHCKGTGMRIETITVLVGREVRESPFGSSYGGDEIPIYKEQEKSRVVCSGCNGRKVQIAVMKAKKAAGLEEQNAAPQNPIAAAVRKKLGISTGTTSTKRPAPPATNQTVAGKISPV